MERIFAAVMNEALISIGSNEDKEANLAFCQQLINKEFRNRTYSEIALTAPYGEQYKTDFLNQLVLISTNKKLEEVSELLKSMEQEIGRRPNDSQQGMIRIDIDLVMWNKKVLKPKDMVREYMPRLLQSLSPTR